MTTPLLPDLTDEAVNATAKWWADHLRNRTPSNNGEPMHGMLKDWANKGIVLSDELVDQFEAAVRAEILSDRDLHEPDKLDERKTKRISFNRDRSGVDYGPDRLLCAAIAACGEKANGTADNPHSKIARLLPWKSSLRISAVSVTGAAGYGNPHDALWRAWDEFPIAQFQVVDRWCSERYGGRWLNGGREDAKVALITLAHDTVEPTIVARILRGVVSVDGYSPTLEDQIWSAFRDDMGGYLALVAPKKGGD